MTASNGLDTLGPLRGRSAARCNRCQLDVQPPAQARLSCISTASYPNRARVSILHILRQPKSTSRGAFCKARVFSFRVLSRNSKYRT